MVTLAKICLVMTVVLGLAFAEPRPSYSKEDKSDEVVQVNVVVQEKKGYRKFRTYSTAADTGDLENEGEMGGKQSRSAVGLPPLRCPEKDYELSSSDWDKFEDIASWSDCGKLCKIMAKTRGCEYWTWDKEDQKCYLTDNYSGGQEFARMVSGKRGCV